MSAYIYILCAYVYTYKNIHTYIHTYIHIHILLLAVRTSKQVGISMHTGGWRHRLVNDYTLFTEPSNCTRDIYM
jgi:hypothetical protein